jgi:hypothetical protein
MPVLCPGTTIISLKLFKRIHMCCRETLAADKLDYAARQEAADRHTLMTIESSIHCLSHDTPPLEG